MHEIITLQFGQRSNYLATHFWNAQESYFTYSGEEESIVDHDIHFRPGIGAEGSETFTPRTVIYDLKGGFGSLKKINALYEIEEPVAPQALWNGPTVVQRQNTIQQSEYQQSLEAGLETPQLTTSSVRYWSDFNRVYYHPKSIVQLNEYELNSNLMPFENWDAGEELFSSLDKEHDLLDRDLRPFAEEADQLQGIQMLTGIDDAWGGFAARFVDRIRDEYGKTAIFVLGNHDSAKSIPREKRMIRLSNTSRSFSEIAPQSSMFVPAALPSTRLPSYINLDSSSEWHKSALLITAWESMTLPSRLRSHNQARETLDQLENTLNINGNQNIARLQMSVKQIAELNGGEHKPSGEEKNANADQRMSSHNDQEEIDQVGERTDLSASFDIDFFANDLSEQTRYRRASKRLHIFGQAQNSRTEEVEHSTNEQVMADQGYERARRRAAGLTITRRNQIPLLFPILDSFPDVYTRQDSSSNISLDVALSTETSIALLLKDMRRTVNRVVGIAEREALGNTLGEMAEAYEEGWDSGSDEEDD